MKELSLPAVATYLSTMPEEIFYSETRDEQLLYRVDGVLHCTLDQELRKSHEK